MNKDILYVQIMGRQYPVESNPGDELYVNRVARFVEERMLELKGSSKTADTITLAVMAAMNIADELFRLQEGRGTLSQNFDTKADELLVLLDKALNTQEAVR